MFWKYVVKNKNNFVINKNERSKKKTTKITTIGTKTLVQCVFYTVIVLFNSTK